MKATYKIEIEREQHLRGRRRDKNVLPDEVEHICTLAKEAERTTIIYLNKQTGSLKRSPKEPSCQ